MKEISRDPGQLQGLSWSGGLHLSAPGGLSLSPSLCRLSVSLFLSSWTCRSLSTSPNPACTSPDPGQFSPAMRGHLWEFIPDASCSLHPLLSPPSFSFCHSTHTTPHLHVFLLTTCPINHLHFLMHITKHPSSSPTVSYIYYPNSLPYF